MNDRRESAPWAWGLLGGLTGLLTSLPLTTLLIYFLGPLVLVILPFVLTGLFLLVGVPGFLMSSQLRPFWRGWMIWTMGMICLSALWYWYLQQG
ncbi:hypothetical protein FHS43_002057 [Streptosporangium becharense]|uniref:Uncharacterized protein n=1 Tax=Streptosporangium becharense TaxID=1816182 RepID=A0A7W9IB64_9ACTN|nr:hypothetical protein [Streptosporangium becharense]MBB2910794.1 hypothetical protein [Streptosporangium becharense]MBB5817489.1 hypothetical protein [Streptosporangium becharense]